MTEVDLDDYYKILDSRPLISDKTKTSYLSVYKKLTRELAKPIRNSTQKQILETIDEISDKLTTRNVLINMAIIVFQLYEKDTGLLLKRREKNSLNNKRVRIETNHAKLKYLPGRQKLLNHLEDLYKEKRWEEYIINYLLIYLNLRNQDLNLLITRKGLKIKEGKKGNKSFVKDNFLVVRSRDITLFRSNYKTYSTYGTKSNSIQSKKFRKAVLGFIEEQQADGDFTPLLHKANGQRISDGFLHEYINKRTFDNLNESDYMKIVVNYVDEKGNLNNLRQLASNRGTDVNTIIENYNLKFELPPNKVEEL